MDSLDKRADVTVRPTAKSELQRLAKKGDINIDSLDPQTRNKLELDERQGASVDTNRDYTAVVTRALADQKREHDEQFSRIESQVDSLEAERDMLLGVLERARVISRICREHDAYATTHGEQVTHLEEAIATYDKWCIQDAEVPSDPSIVSSLHG